MCVVSPVCRTEAPTPEITPKVPQIIDLEITEALEQRRQAFREENHPSRKINHVIIEMPQNRGIFGNKISNTKIIILDSQSETEPVSE